MYNDLQKEAFKIVDDFLKDLADQKISSFNTYAKPTSYFIAKDYLDNIPLITYRNPGGKHSLVDIHPNGLKVLSLGGIENYLNLLEEQQQLKTKKDTLELELLELEKKQIQSVIATNESVKATNQSVVATNNSVQKVNGFFKAILAATIVSAIGTCGTFILEARKELAAPYPQPLDTKEPSVPKETSVQKTPSHLKPSFNKDTSNKDSIQQNRRNIE